MMPSAPDSPTATTPLTGAAAPPPSPSAPAAALAPWKRRLFTAVTLLIVLGALELMAGVYLRVTRGYDGEHLYQYDYDPYKNILPARKYVDTRGIRHNAQGFRRDSLVALAREPGSIRVFLMGASTAYGLGGLWPHLQREYEVIPNEQTIDAYLERDLRQAFPGRKVEVINAAITSTWTHHSLIYLNQTILKFQPDMILLLDGYNDFYHYEPWHDQFATYSYSMAAQSIMGPPTTASLLHGIGWWLFRKSALVHVAGRAARVVKLAVTPRPDQPPIDVPAAMAGLREKFPANALKMHRRIGLIARDEGVIPVFMLQPMLVLERGRERAMPEIERKLFDFNVSSARPNAEAYYTEAAQFVRQQEAAMAQDVGGHFIDLTRIYAGQKAQIFTDYAHLTPRGNELLAAHVASRIRPLLAARLAAADSGRTSAVAIAPSFEAR